MEYTEHIINQVRSIVSPVYLVGGSVRDLLLKKTPNDFDFNTPLSPDEIEAAAKKAGRHVYAIGKKFGTIGFKVEDMNGAFQKVEVTTFRSEKYEPGNRKPQVEFVSDLRDDLSRRDFTINAIAYDTDYIDPFGGRMDIMARKIKSVGKATDRFKEDPLRMLRAARFAAQLGFTVDPNMIGFIRKLSSSISTISRERWVQELDKLLVSDNPMKGLEVIYDGYMLRYMLPEVRLAYIHSRMRDALSDRLDNSPKDADIRWGILLWDIGKPVIMSFDIMAEEYGRWPQEEIIGLELARGICLRLKFSNERMAVIEDMFKNKKRWEQKYEKDTSHNL